MIFPPTRLLFITSMGMRNMASRTYSYTNMVMNFETTMVLPFKGRGMSISVSLEK